MSYAAYKMMHWPTGIENCASGFVTNCRADFTPQIPLNHTEDLESDWSSRRGIGPVPNLIVTAANVLELYVVRVQEEGTREARNSTEVKRGGIMDGVSAVSLELVCSYSDENANKNAAWKIFPSSLVLFVRLHGNVESMAVLSIGGGDVSRRRDSIILTFQDAKIAVLEFDDSTHSLQTSSMHCFESPEWLHLKRGRESFARGPLVKADPQGRCSGVLVYGLQMIILKAAQAGSGFVGEDDAFGSGTTVSARVESSYIIDLRDLDMKHIKDFIFVHGYIEPVMVILHERELTWAGRVSWKHHTCMISALSISTTLKQHPLIWSAADPRRPCLHIHVSDMSNLPHDAYKLLAVPSPIGGVLVISANMIHYHSQSASCALALNSYAASVDNSQELPRSSFNVELDAANATWLLNDVALLSAKTGELLLLTLVYDGRVVQRLDLSKSKASVLTSDITTIGNSLVFLGSRLGDSLLVQFSSGSGASTLPSGLKEEVGDIEGDVPLAKRLRRSSSDALQDGVGSEELSLYGSTPNNSESAQKAFLFAVRDSLINVGPLKDFSYGLRINADANATGIAKQSNYELVCCSGHGKNGALCVLRQSVRPEMITEVELTGCKGIWTVYHKSTRGHNVDSSKLADDDDEYHAYLIISLEARTMVLETADLLTEVTESVDYYVQGRTIAAGNLFGRRRVIQVFERGARILDGSFMTQELSIPLPNSETSSGSDNSTVMSVSIADPYVLLRMTDGSILLLVGDPATCTVSINSPAAFEGSKKRVSACSLYHDKGPEPWLRKASSDAWLSTGIGESIDSADGGPHDQGDIYCVICYENGALEIFDVPNFNCVFSVEKFASGRAYLVDAYSQESSEDSEKPISKSSEELAGQSRKENVHNLKVVELAMQRWSGNHSRPFIFGILTDGTILCYHAYLFEGPDNASKVEGSASAQNSVGLSNVNASRLRNLRFIRVSLDAYTREETSNGTLSQRITIFKNISGYQGFFLSGLRPAWFMVFRQRLRIHPQICDGSIVAFTVLHNVNCNHGFIYVTSQGILKICQMPSTSNYDNYWPVQKIPLRGTPHQVTYFAERNLYPLIVSVPVHKPVNQVLSSLVDQEAGHQMDNLNLSSDELHRTYTVEEFEVRILEPEKSGGPWETKATISMQSSENALTVRVVTLFRADLKDDRMHVFVLVFYREHDRRSCLMGKKLYLDSALLQNTTTKENETLLAIGTAYVQGEDVAARGRVLLFSIGRSTDNNQNLVSEVYSKELKGAISALASLQGHLLIASGPKIILHIWTGSELNGIAFYDAPPLYVVSLNIVKNFILLGDVHKSIYFLSWKEQGAQLSLLAKDFGSLDCFATEFLIDGSTLSLMVSDDQKNIQVFYYAPKMSESWRGQKLLSRAEFHVGAHVTKFLRLQMLSTSGRTSATAGSDKTNRFALLFGTLDGSIGCIAPLDELTFRRLQSLQKKLVDAVPHVAGLNPRSFRHFRSNGKAHRPGPDSIVDCELLCQ
ncbi:cleavage and polyadenylation specificity factor subunit 1 isoform X1 [Gossypium australe]|uniref:Cleavage and polyadenylation specificity factor subunit 1 isoform X1 n=1 Tax=Gossypium australe TaxID=47621 RepID=A0A5B6UER4_9ROSI|nr:cleavage and polyadenylation specificity factor subunit 1 isoform X1 [Gossypium australe]